MIKSKVADGEEVSPYYLANLKFCEEVEQFIDKQGGTSKGVCSAWAYSVRGKFSARHEWEVNYRKSSLSGVSHQTSKDKLLIVVAEWTCNIPATKSAQFTIEPKSFVNTLKSYISPSTSLLGNHPNYMLTSKSVGRKTQAAVVDVLRSVLLAEEVLSIVHDEDGLKIMIRTESHQFDVLSRLVLNSEL